MKEHELLRIFIELSNKADAVNHDILMGKLEYYGLSGNIGVVQLSVLELILCIIYVNDFLTITTIRLQIMMTLTMRKVPPPSLCFFSEYFSIIMT